MPAYHVERSTTIDAPIARVRPAIEDYRQWPKWSPWLCCEPDCKLEFFGTPGQSGHGYKWDGKVVGAGQMNLRSNNGQMEMDLDFIRPFKSHADVRMVLSSMGENQTQVTWHLNGKMPFFLFFLVGMMKSMIRMDFERGLRMLKEYVETGTVNSHCEFVGVVELPEMHYVGVTDHCNMAQIGDSMKRTLPQAYKLATENQLDLAGPCGSIYNKVDLKRQEFTYTAFSPVKKLKAVPDAVTGTMGNCKALKVIHTGAYENLGNAWSMIMAHQRYKKHKLLKAQPAFEVYVNDPSTVQPTEIVTEVYVPIKS
jgi:effector-binding domain-containing protein